MKKWVRISLISIGSLLVLALIVAGTGYTYVQSTFVDFEEDYRENKKVAELDIDGVRFLDRNANGKLDVYEDSRRSLEERVEDAHAQMTLEEKIHLLKGSGLASALGKGEPGEGIPGAAGTIVPTPRLGLPTVYLSDGPAGLRILPTREGEDRTYYATAFPIASLLSSTWNDQLVYEVGAAMGKEALEYGLDVMLAPGVNIHRHPLCGRNFEYYSEDPWLSGLIGSAMVNGIQSNGVGTSVKHYVANNQETNRYNNDAIVSERAMREIYLKGFEIMVKRSQPWTIMSSYNKVNGTYTSESHYLLTEVLRDEWGFQGLVMTDWFGGYDAVAQVNAGNDLLEPGTKRQWDALIEGYENGELSLNAIDTSVKRILRQVFKSPKMRGYHPSNDPDLKAHARITRKSAAEGMVLLKNESTLPLKGKKEIALIGVNSFEFIAGGTGSGDVNEAYSISLEQGMTNAGFTINDQSKALFESHKKANPEGFVKPVGMDAIFNPFDPPQMDYTEQQLAAMAEDTEVAILTIGRNSGEGGDRVEQDDFKLSVKEQALIAATCKEFQARGKKVVVILNVGGVVETASWKQLPDAILLAWQGGQEGGNSVADILSGKVNPSGKLPMTFPMELKDHASNANFPLAGEPISFMDAMNSGKVIPEDEKEANTDFTVYEEGVYVGYRHFDKAELSVSYPFGYGLSYTDFKFDELEVEIQQDTIHLSLIVENIGKLAGKEVVQLYVSKIDTTVDRPLQELKAYAKTSSLQPETSETIELAIPVGELSYWNENKGAWVLEPGDYKLTVGNSSRNSLGNLIISLE